LKIGGDKRENQVISILQKMDEKLEYIGKKLDSVEKIVHEQGETLKEHSAILENHSIILKDHSIMLSTLKTGQEFVSAEISDLRMQNANDFGEIKATLKSHEDSIVILKEDKLEQQENDIKNPKNNGSFMISIWTSQLVL
jgi:hypothetical protein